MGGWPTQNVVFFDQLLAGTQASFDIQNIPAGYRYLQLQAFLREDDAVTNSTPKIRFNNDSGSNYDSQVNRAFQTSVSPIETLAGTSAQMISCSTGASATANLFSLLTVEMYQYDQTLDEHVFQFEGNSKASTTTGSYIHVTGTGYWRSNSAVNRITLLPFAGNWVSHSRCTLTLCR